MLTYLHLMMLERKIVILKLIYLDWPSISDKTLAKLRDLNLNSKQVEDVDQIIVLKEASSSKGTVWEHSERPVRSRLREDGVDNSITIDKIDKKWGMSKDNNNSK